MFQQQNFAIGTDTGGDWTDTGPPFSGLVMQMRYNRGDTGAALALDTGADIRVEMIRSGVVVADYDNAGGSSWTRVPRVPTYDTGGTAIADQYACAAHDRLRVTVTQSDGVAGSKAGEILVVTEG